MQPSSENSQRSAKPGTTSHAQPHHLHEVGQQPGYSLWQRVVKHDAALRQSPASGIEGAVLIHTSLDAARQELAEKSHTADGQAESGRQIPHQAGVPGHVDPPQLDSKDIQERGGKEKRGNRYSCDANKVHQLADPVPPGPITNASYNQASHSLHHRSQQDDCGCDGNACVTS